MKTKFETRDISIETKAPWTATLFSHWGKGALVIFQRSFAKIYSYLYHCNSCLPLLQLYNFLHFERLEFSVMYVVPDLHKRKPDITVYTLRDKKLKIIVSSKTVKIWTWPSHIAVLIFKYHFDGRNRAAKNKRRSLKDRILTYFHLLCRGWISSVFSHTLGCTRFCLFLTEGISIRRGYAYGNLRETADMSKR